MATAKKVTKKKNIKKTKLTWQDEIKNMLLVMRKEMLQDVSQSMRD